MKKNKKENYPLNRHDRLELERGSYLKKWKDKCPIAIIYPNTYAVGMSSLGFQLVYSLLNERDDIVCERFFLPEGKETLVSIESGRPLKDFPFLLFSISFEHDYLNLVKILLAGGVAPYSHSRATGKGAHPFVVCGGVATFMNPEPIAPFADLIVVGEAEPLLGNLMDFLLENHHSMSYHELKLKVVQKCEGIYAPSLYTPEYDDTGRCSALVPEYGVKKRVKRAHLITCQKASHSEVLTAATEFSNLYLTELGRGCSRGCRFCAAGYIYRPPRLWDVDAVMQALGDCEKDVNRIGLLGMEMAGNSTLEHISSYLVESGCALSFSSLRADRINNKLLDLLSKSALKSVAIAPDGASERLRSVINKGLDQTDLLNAAKNLVEAGIYKLKLYVMVGLPTETCEDLQELIDLITHIKSEIDTIGRKRGRLTEIYLSVNCFVPKPWTPFQFHPFGINGKLEPNETSSSKEALANLKEKIMYLKNGVKPLANIHFQSDKPENAMFQAVLARGDRRIAGVLHDIATQHISWKKSMKNNQLSVEQFILTGSHMNSYFPWYIIDHGIDNKYLWHEYMKGLREALSEPCDTSICRRCGVCGES